MNYEELNKMLKEMDKIPFPKIEVRRPNILFTRELYNSYAGSGGELTAITQYIYENIAYENRQNIANLLLAVAIQEMRHLKTLGGILVKNGVTPYYIGSKNDKWCSNNVRYNFQSIEEMLKYNIGTEEEAIREYKRLIERTNNETIRATLERIIMDEENHIKVFNGIGKQLRRAF